MLLPPFNLTRTIFPRLSSKILVVISLIGFSPLFRLDFYRLSAKWFKYYCAYKRV
jgi:hypothetical protein